MITNFIDFIKPNLSFFSNLYFSWFKHQVVSRFEIINFSSMFDVSIVILFYLFVFCLIILFGLIILRTINKIGFFGKQPLNHKFDFINKFKKDGLINDYFNDKPEWDKYCDIENVAIIESDNLSKHSLNTQNPKGTHQDSLITNIINLINNSQTGVNHHKMAIKDVINIDTNEYNSTNDNKNNSKNQLNKNQLSKNKKTNKVNNLSHKAQLISFLTTHNTLSYITTYNCEKYGLKCVILSTPATLKIINKNSLTRKKHNNLKQLNQIISLPIYNLNTYQKLLKTPDVTYTYNSKHTKFIDYISNNLNTSDTDYQKTFATFHYFQLSNNTIAQVSLFKSTNIWNVKPLCQVNDMLFIIDKTLDYKFDVKRQLRFNTIQKENIRSLLDFLDLQINKELFSIVVTPDIGHLIELINVKLIVVVGCFLNNTMIGVLFFKTNLCDSINTSVIELFASVFDDSINSILRRACFSRSLMLANKTFKASYLIINNTSHNQSILEMIDIKDNLKTYNQSKIVDMTYSYYLRNYRTNIIHKSCNCLIIL